MNTTESVVAKESRGIERIVEGVATSDGAGVKLTRVLSGRLQQRLDPFLMLDAFASENPDDYIAGFPDHPHRGLRRSPTCWPAICGIATARGTRACWKTAACSG